MSSFRRLNPSGSTRTTRTTSYIRDARQPSSQAEKHYGSVLNAEFDSQKHLATLRSDGLNLTRLFCGSYVEAPSKSFGIHKFLAYAAERGIVVELTLFSSQYADTQWKLSPFNRANNINHTTAIDWKKLNTLDNGGILQYQEQYVRKIVEEANRFDNVIFEIANEPWSDSPVRVAVRNPYLPAAVRDKFPNSVDVATDATLA